MLYRVHGLTGLASCNGFDYFLIKGLHIGGVLSVPLLLLTGFALPFVVVVPGVLNYFVALLAFYVLLVPSAIYILWLFAMGITLPVMIGYALTSRQPTFFDEPVSIKTPASGTRLAGGLSFHSLSAMLKRWNLRRRLLLYWLRAWYACVGFPLLAFSLIIGVAVIPITLSDPTLRGIDTASLIGSLIVIYGYGTFGFILAINLFIVLPVALPFTLTVQTQLFGEMAAHSQRLPATRRSALRLAIKLLTFNGFCLLFGAIYSLHASSVFDSLSAPISSSLPPFITPRQLIYILLLILLYGLYIELPYRLGLKRWQAKILGEFAQRRKTVDQRLNQSLTPDQTRPLTIQDDYALWQYYHAQEEEVKKTQPGPFSLVQRGWILFITFFSSFALDQIRGVLMKLVLHR